MQELYESSGDELPRMTVQIRVVLEEDPLTIDAERIRRYPSR